MRSPRIFGVRLSVLVGFYRWRLREHPVQELLAAAGIAAGVALVFGVLVANTSISGSARELVHGIVGDAQLQLAARSADGMDAGLEAPVRRLPGVRSVAPLLREQATLVGPDGRQSIQLMGVTPALAALGGDRTRDVGPSGMRLAEGLALPASLADGLGIRSGATATVLIRGARRRVPVGATLGDGTLGSLGRSPIAIVPLGVLQRLGGMEGRVSQLLVLTEPGRERAVADGLREVADGRLDVRPADAELDVLDATSRPNDLSTGLFAAISAMVGFLLAVNAMLLTAPERRRWVADLRSQGFSARQVLLTLAFDALVLGLVASVVGVLLGDVLSRTLFGEVPVYLAFAFPVGSERIVTTGAVVLAIAGGVVATLLASLLPAADLRSSRPNAILEQIGEAGEGVGRRTAVRLALVGAAIVAGSAVASLLLPPFTVVAGVLLAAAALCFVPAAFALAIGALGRATVSVRRSVLPLAVIELRAAATRSIALGCVAALAVYGCVAIEGARGDLVRGLDRTFGEYLQTTDFWITTGGDDLTTNSFRPPPGATASIARVPGVRSVRIYQGGLLDVGDRRLWVAARAPDDRAIVSASQVVAGDAGAADRRLRGSGWATVSETLADDRGVAVGDRIVLPTPAGQARLRVAAVTTNLGWPPGAVVLGTADYRRLWRTTDPSAIHVDVSPRTSLSAARRGIEAALGVDAGLRVQTAAERQDQYAALSRQGLRSLRQIAILLLFAVGIAVAVALSAALWQRRPRLADLKAEGFSHRQLWRGVLWESAIVLVVGGAVGAVLGLYGHALASRWLQLATGFPAPFALGVEQVLLTVAALAAIALATLAVPGYAATSVPPRGRFQE